jgi:hypothetical protein
MPKCRVSWLGASPVHHTGGIDDCDRRNSGTAGGFGSLGSAEFRGLDSDSHRLKQAVA